LLLGPFEAQAGDGEAESIVGLLENAPCGGIGVGKRLAHAGSLRTLSGEKKGGGGCQSELYPAARRAGMILANAARQNPRVASGRGVEGMKAYLNFRFSGEIGAL
jgi:hypothetical protein